MNKLKKDQKDEFAVSYAILALYDGGAEVTSEQINTLLEATGNTQVAPYYPIIFSNFLNTPAKIGAAIANPGAGGGGGGGGGGGTFWIIVLLWVVPPVSFILILLCFLVSTKQAVPLLVELQQKLKKKSLKKRKKLIWAEAWICSVEVMPAGAVTTKHVICNNRVQLSFILLPLPFDFVWFGVTCSGFSLL